MKRSILALTALNLLFGAQFLRMLLPSLTWYLEEVLGVNFWQAVLIWLAPFALALAAPLLVWWLKPRGALWVAGAGLILCRLIMEQAWTPRIVNVLAVLGGTACFLCLLSLLYGLALAEGGEGTWAFGAGLLFGLSLDTALRGLTGTLDLTWIHGPWPRLMVIALVGVFAYALWQGTPGQVSLAAPSFPGNLPLIGVGLFLFVEWLSLQNQGWMETFTGWPPAASLGWILLGDLVALLAATTAVTNAWLRSTRWWLVLPGAAVTVALAFAQAPGWPYALVALVGLVSAGVLLVVNVGVASRSPSRATTLQASVALWPAMFVIAMMVVVYGVAYEVKLPFGTSALLPAAAAGLALCALGAARLRPREPAPVAVGWGLSRLAALLLLAPVGLWATEAWRAPVTVHASGYPVRVMTYNIRDAYGMSGRQDVEAIAQVIEGAGTDVVALQEAGRGSLLDNGADLVSLLSRRLNMPYDIFEPSIDPLFGDAILSRYPILASGQGPLPRLDTPVARSYVWAQVDLGSGDKLLVLTTHLLYPPGGSNGSAVRVAQAQALLVAWAARPQLVLLGDMNARIGSPEMQIMLDGGLMDSWAESGQGERPGGDWIFHTRDLVARQTLRIDSPASDHSAVVATFVDKP